MTINDVPIEETFAEAFPMTGTRLVITAETPGWAMTAARTMTGYGCSVIGCDAEAGVERVLEPEESPDGRPGVAVLAFAFSREALEAALVRRVGQCVMTCPTTACYNGLPLEPGAKEAPITIGGKLRYFGDGWQIAKRLGRRRLWRVPVMDGEFTCEDKVFIKAGVAGGNLIVVGREPAATLGAAEAAAAACRSVDGVILPFPGGIARSGSKVGSKYPQLMASTNTAFAPTLRGLVETSPPEEVGCCYEIVIDGLTLEAVERATAVGVRAAAALAGVLRITAGNYGGRLGPHHIRLHEVLERYSEASRSQPSGS